MFQCYICKWKLNIHALFCHLPHSKVSVYDFDTWLETFGFFFSKKDWLIEWLKAKVRLWLVLSCVTINVQAETVLYLIAAITCVLLPIQTSISLIHVHTVISKYTKEKKTHQYSCVEGILCWNVCYSFWASLLLPILVLLSFIKNSILLLTKYMYVHNGFKFWF